MDIGRITPIEIKRALDHLRQARPLDGHALLESSVVTVRLGSEGLTDTPESRTWILAGLLETLVRNKLSRKRGRAEVGVGAAGRTLAEAQALIRSDFAAADPDREAWSCLYYRYFSRRALQVNELAALGRPGSRHGRKFIARRITHGLSMIASILRELELLAEDQTVAPSHPGSASTIEGPAPDEIIASLRNAIIDPISASPSHNLPARPSRFVGREPELAQVQALLERTRCVTLTGTGGAGKTRLALEIANRLMEHGRRDTWFIDLSALDAPALIAESIADVLGVSEDASHAPLAAIIEAIGDRPTLLLLDNCEHLIDASAEMAESLLYACPALRILATSREPLDIEGEQSWPLPPLSIPPEAERDDPARAGQHAAVALFADRARSANPSFALDTANVRDVCQICSGLDGLPLAIELAAARVRAIPPERIRARLSERFSLLGRGRRTADPRQRTLWAAIDWSHALLEPADQMLLRRMSVFQGGWTLSAAEQVASGDGLVADRVVEQLSSLVDKSLVLPPTEPGDGARPRYDMLETIRAFARIKLRDAEEETAFHRSHLSWVLALAEEAAPALTSQDQSDWLARLTAEVENLRHTLTWALKDIPSQETGLRIAALLTPFWKLRGRPSEGRQWLEQLLATEVGSKTSALRAQALDGAGALAFQQGDYTAAGELHSESLAIHRDLGAAERVAESLRHLGNLADEMGDYDRAVAHYDEALATWRELGHAWGIAATINNLGLVALRRGQLDLASAHLEDSLERFRELGTDWAVGVTLSNLGDTALARGEGTEARQRMADSLSIARRLDDQEGIAYALTGMAHAEILLGHLHPARRLLGESLVVLERMGHQLGLAEWLEVAAILVAARGRPADATQIHAAVEALREAIESPLPPKDRDAKRSALSALETELGATDFESLWIQGRTLRWQDAAALAMAGD